MSQQQKQCLLCVTTSAVNWCFRTDHLSRLSGLQIFTTTIKCYARTLQGNELGTLDDADNVGWADEATEDLSIEAESALREKRRVERERKLAEHQIKKQEKQAVRKDRTTAVKLSWCWLLQTHFFQPCSTRIGLINGIQGSNKIIKMSCRWQHDKTTSFFSNTKTSSFLSLFNTRSVSTQKLGVWIEFCLFALFVIICCPFFQLCYFTSTGVDEE